MYTHFKTRSMYYVYTLFWHPLYTITHDVILRRPKSLRFRSSLLKTCSGIDSSMCQYNDILHTLQTIVVYICTKRLTTRKHYLSHSHYHTSFDSHNQLLLPAAATPGRQVFITEPEYVKSDKGAESFRANILTF